MAPRLETPWRRASKPLRRPSKPHGAAPRNPMAPRLETPAPRLETPWRRASKPLGTKFETKIFKFRWFLGPSDQNELYHTPLLSKIFYCLNLIFWIIMGCGIARFGRK